MIKGSDIPIEKEIFSEVWEFLKEAYRPVTDDDWMMVLAKAEKIAGKYENTIYSDLARNLCIGVIEHMGRLQHGV